MVTLAFLDSNLWRVQKSENPLTHHMACLLCDFCRFFFWKSPCKNKITLAPKSFLGCNSRVEFIFDGFRVFALRFDIKTIDFFRNSIEITLNFDAKSRCVSTLEGEISLDKKYFWVKLLKTVTRIPKAYLIYILTIERHYLHSLASTLYFSKKDFPFWESTFFSIEKREIFDFDKCFWKKVRMHDNMIICGITCPS